MSKLRFWSICTLLLLVPSIQGICQIINPSFEDLATVTDELVTLTGTNPVALAHSSVIPESFVVTNQDKTITYTRDVDYTIHNGFRIAHTKLCHSQRSNRAR